MARIRSIHPGQWTDEDFVQCSFPARLLAIALRNEADDNGVFEWKPLGLKMRLFPADNVDVEALLEELIAHKQVTKYELDGFQLGAVRNFCRYQRPKKAKSLHPMTDMVRNYVGMKEREFRTGGEPEDDETTPVPQNAEKSRQMEEVGGRREEPTNQKPPPPSGAPPQQGHRLPSDWVLSDDDAEFATQEGLNDAAIQREFAKFRDHWLAKSGRDSTKLNWSLVWRNWVRRAADGGLNGVGRGLSPGQRQGPASFAEAAMRAVARDP